MAILLQVGSAMHRGTIRRYIDTISGSSLRPAVSAVSLADSALLDPIGLTQILRPHSLALVLSLLLSSSFSLLSPPRPSPRCIHSLSHARVPFFSFCSFGLLFLPIVLTFFLSPASALLSLSLLFTGVFYSFTRVHAFSLRFSLPPFFFFFLIPLA